MHLFAGTSAGKLYHLVANTLTPTELMSSHLGAVTACGFGIGSSEAFATISMDGSLRVWSLSSHTLQWMATETVGGLSLAFTKDKHPLIVTGWADGAVRAFDAATAQKKWQLANAHRGDVTSVATSVHYIVSGASDGAVNVWSTQTRELVLTFHEHKRGVTQVLVDVAKPHWIHSCGLDKALFIYDLKSERRVMAQQTRDTAFHGITQRLDSETEILTAGSDGRIHFWDCDLVEPVQCLVDVGHVRVCAVSVSPSGKFLATCGDDCAVKIYDVQTLALVTAGVGHSDTITNLCWSPDERQLVAVGVDSCVSVWNFYTES
jgi:cilia- and flagella-associated protein 52